MTTKQSPRTAAAVVTNKASTKQTSTSKTATPEPTQLRLLDGGRSTPRAWQLDARTRRIGRERVAEARAILRNAQPHDKIAG